MKKMFKTLVSAGAALSLLACSSSGSSSAAGTTASSAESLYTAGTYTASAAGHSSDVVVTAEFSGSAIEKVELDVSGETETPGQAAAEELISQIMEAQSADIDGVSGATETSTAVKMAMQDIMAQAQGLETSSAETTGLTDGTYTESVQSFGFTGDMTGDVTIQDGKIASIEITSETDSATGQWFSVAQKLLIPRIIEAQSIGVDSITGATTSSGAIKNLVGKAIDEAGGDSTQWRTPVEKSTETVTKEGYDVIVVGLGGSGILSYCAAAQEGASVFGMEAAGAIGGNSVSVYGPMALNSENMKEKYTNGEDYINEDDVYNTWIEYVGTDEKADVIKKAVYNSGSALDYYMDNFDFSFDGLNGLLGSFVVPEWTQEWTVYTADADNTKWYVLGPDHTFQFEHALDKAKAMNENNDYMTELKAEELITDADGNITGVRATYYDGTTYEIYGKTVILATGGFVGNEDMMKEYLGSTVTTIGCTVNKGDGIRMGMSVGGATYAMGTLPMIHISQVPNVIRTDELTADQKAILSALAVTTDMPMVTVNGEPWGNVNQSGTSEETGLSVEIAYAPGFRYYVMYTQEDIDNIKANGLSEAQAAAVVNFVGNGGTLPEAGTPVADIEDIIAVGEKYNNVIKGDSIADLAAKLDVDEATLSETLGGQDGTYYAVVCAGWSYGTVGSLDVDENMNVLKEDGTPIANLFAVGQDSEGVCNADGKAYSPWGGQAQSWTFVSGQIAGTQAAAYTGE